MASRKTVLARLGALSHAAPSREEVQERLKQANADKNDRGAALLIAATVETALATAIQKYLHLPTMDDDLFRDQGAPLATFANKIRMGVALRIYGPKTMGNLMLIKGIRNAFAHAALPITFETKEVVRACESLIPAPHRFRTTLPAMEIGAHLAVDGPPARRKFQIVSHSTAFFLLSQANMAMPFPINQILRNFPAIPAGNLEAWLMPQPLP